MKSALALLCCLTALGYAAPAASKAFYQVLNHGSDPQVSADGNVVIAKIFIPDFAGTAYRWTLSPSGVTTEILPLPFVILTAVNGDGSLIVGFDGSGAFRWTAAGGIQSLGVPGSRATDVSSDGTVVVGMSDQEAFVSSEILGFQPVGFLRGDTSSEATAVAGDFGGVVVGYSLNSGPRQ